MRKYIVAFVLAVLFVLAISPIASADNGPHGGFNGSTGACAGCHRAHSAGTNDGFLLITYVPALCFTCHDGTGAYTNVVNGTYVAGGGEGAGGRGLRAGGYVNGLMDVNRDGNSSLAPVTSAHTYDGVAGTAWGNGAINSGPGLANYSVDCATCHNPHGSASYRILRPNMTGVTAPSVLVADELPKNYTVTDSNNLYLGQIYEPVRFSTLSLWCSECHTRYLAGAGSGHISSGDAIFNYRHNTIAVPCLFCHTAHGTTAAMGVYSDYVPWPDGSVTPNNDQRSVLLRADNRDVCVPCHLSNGVVIPMVCDSCHGLPPDTGAHLAHSGSITNVSEYGLTGATNTTSGYGIACGECHPTDIASHRDGTVEVSISPAGAPLGSLKSRNAAGAAYSGGSCGGVYCHSGQQVSSGAVGDPLMSGGSYILDAYGNFTYAPYTVNISRNYRSTPAWNGGSVSGNCTDCHNFPLTTSVPGVQAGVGDSHQWIDNYGYGNLHAYNMSYAPIQCRTCHYGEITAAGATNRNGMDVTTYSPVPLADLTNHVNGQKNVQFEASVSYYGATKIKDLTVAAYNPTTNSCSNVGCHLSQRYVVWGAPYRWWTNECDICHRYYLPPAPLAPLQAFGANANPHLNMDGKTCQSCHPDVH